ncbi:hypothetical protein GCM10011402_00750 [Paracoccus acridae]|uniref:Uncharacterized protein n=1 Tax=Paracoccus acridae TaxID=1795310 RepID=A0ABQ1VBS7_9RHOB|nr:hypothetical protein GCM10011402_00750 [Paracoccus acridae]
MGIGFAAKSVGAPLPQQAQTDRRRGPPVLRVHSLGMAPPVPHVACRLSLWIAAAAGGISIP